MVLSSFRFGPYEVDLRAHELRKHGLRIKLREKSFEILVCLLEHPTEVVTREQLRRQLWPEDVFVNFDDSLNTAVNRLRDALGERARGRRYIETLHGTGYRSGGGKTSHCPLRAGKPIPLFTLMQKVRSGVKSGGAHCEARDGPRRREGSMMGRVRQFRGGREAPIRSRSKILAATALASLASLPQQLRGEPLGNRSRRPESYGGCNIGSNIVAV
jgi:DNA-binding winged helix-turn-helix (wHTH) protein